MCNLFLPGPVDAEHYTVLVSGYNVNTRNTFDLLGKQMQKLKPGACRFDVRPRTDLTPSDSTLLCSFTRRHFPIRIAFTMTINNVQGQTLDKVGLYLPRPVFGHGHLYVTM